MQLILVKQYRVVVDTCCFGGGFEDVINKVM